ANPLACAVAACNYRRLLADPPDAPQQLQRFWMQALQPLGEHPRVKDVRIRGSIAAIEMDVPGGYLAEIGRAMRQTCLEHGVLLRPLGSVLYAMPPFCTSNASLQQIVNAMKAAVKRCG
ncbi:MAG: aminotransferase class III-fold pyridoxal phosphate-dependent enzyme, partial [Planctomycetes bacterium]|nr:aminotransferase class III-fold pyridoxal phosphate-dependent enzyme [Planctomycetota bacterium]